MKDRIILLILIGNIICNNVDYNSMQAHEKMNILWNKITENNTSLEYFSKFATFGLFFSSLKPTFEHMSDDTFPNGRKRLIHTVGLVAKAKYVSTGDHDYTGVFQGCENVMIRLSMAKPLDYSKSTPEGAFLNFIPGMAIKFLRDSVHSTNTHVMFSVEGQKSWNFFKNDLSNHIGDTQVFGLNLLGFKFSSMTRLVQTLGLRDLAAINSKGISENSPKYPFQIILKPNNDLRIKFSDSFTVNFIDQLKSVAVNTPIYEVFAVNQPEGTEKKIGTIITESELVTSRFGDESLFFRHNLMDTDLKDNKCWVNHVPSWNFWGTSLPEQKIEGCPYHKKKSDL